LPPRKIAYKIVEIKRTLEKVAAARKLKRLPPDLDHLGCAAVNSCCQPFSKDRAAVIFVPYEPAIGYKEVRKNTSFP
jgi:hypothetical protein